MSKGSQKFVQIDMFQGFVSCSDNTFMGISQIMSTISAVLLNPVVIFAAVVVILYLNFVNYVVRYRKKPPKTKKKKVIAVAPDPAAEGAGEEWVLFAFGEGKDALFLCLSV